MANKFVSSLVFVEGHSGDSEVDAWRLIDAFTLAVAGDYVWIKNDGIYNLSNQVVGVSGSYIDNTHIFFIGYNNINNCDLVNHISDMDYGQPYWGGPLNPTFANGWVNIDGNNCYSPISVFVNNENLHLRNLSFSNTYRLLQGSEGVIVTGNKGISFAKCKFSDAYTGLFLTNNIGSVIDNCYFGLYMSGNVEGYINNVMTLISNCVFYGGAIRVNNAIVNNNLFNGGTFGLNSLGHNVVHNNVFYNQITNCLQYGNTDYPGELIEYNNIFIPYTKAAKAIYKAGNGSLAYSKYGCAYCLAQAGVLDVPYVGEHPLNVDPKFMNPTGNDFRLKPDSPCLNTGKPIIGGIVPGQDVTSRGFWQRKSLLGNK